MFMYITFKAIALLSSRLFARTKCENTDKHPNFWDLDYISHKMTTLDPVFSTSHKIVLCYDSDIFVHAGHGLAVMFQDILA